MEINWKEKYLIDQIYADIAAKFSRTNRCFPKDLMT